MPDLSSETLLETGKIRKGPVYGVSYVAQDMPSPQRINKFWTRNQMHSSTGLLRCRQRCASRLFSTATCPTGSGAERGSALTWTHSWRPGNDGGEGVGQRVIEGGKAAFRRKRRKRAVDWTRRYVSGKLWFSMEGRVRVSSEAFPNCLTLS